MTVEQDVLARIIPTSEEQEKVLSVAHAFVDELKSKVKGAKIILGGSVGKGTWLNDDTDIDVFVAFEEDAEDLSDVLEPYLAAYETDRVHGSRDYFRLEKDGYMFEIVPIVAITNPKEAKNITDISPLHATWVNKNADDAVKDEIRLSKAFFKAQRIYGAESHIKGFSGYVLEILTVHFGSFEKLLKAAGKWKEKSVVDPAKHHKDVFFDVNASKLVSPLIVIDPVQAGRNAAAALSTKRFSQCIAAAKAYLKKNDESYFLRQPLTFPKEAVIVDITSPEGRKDVVGCAVEKVYKHISHLLKKNEFIVTDSDLLFDEKNNAVMFFTFENSTLSEIQERQGPPVTIEEHAKTFKKTYKDNFEKDGILYARVKREYVNAKDLIAERLKDAYVTEKIISAALQ